MTIDLLWPALLRRTLYPGVLLGVGLAAGLLAPGRTEAVVVVGVLAPVLVVLSVAERVLPHARSWKPTRSVLALDVFYTFVSSQGVARLTKVALVAALAAVASAWTHPGGLWPTHWPLWVQVALAVVVADLPLYVAHRMMHDTAAGWRIHLVHHSTTAMHVFASARSHPLNVVVKLVVETGTLLLLGVPPEVMTVWFCLMTTNGLLQHANVDVHTGPLGWVLATPQVHRVHHDAHGDPSNFGSTTTLWDQLFGTFRRPDPARPVHEVGVPEAQVPERYLAHLWVPFRSAGRSG